MLNGVYLTLLIGPFYAVPAPRIVMESLSNIQVTNGKDRSGFQLTFTVGKSSPLLLAMLPAGFFDPITTRVIIVATLNAIPHVIMDGFVTQQELTPSNDVGKSTLTITGEDLSIAMDLEENILPQPGFNLVAQVNITLARYAYLGITAFVVPPIMPAEDSPTKKWPIQTGTDRAFLKEQAQVIGYIFFIMPGPLPGQSIAYFGPDTNLPVPQPALSINLDAQTNLESLSFSLNGLAKVIRVYVLLDPVTNKFILPVPVPNVSIYRPPLSLKPSRPFRKEYDSQNSNLSVAKSAQRVLGFMLNNSSSVTGNGSLDVLRYKWILHPRMRVGVRGAGIAYDGFYDVDSVTHNIKNGEYKQSFTLSRDGLISDTPFVMP